MTPVSGTAPPRPGAQKLSCKRCRYRKLRCSRTTPCASCTAVGAACEYAQVDKRRIPPSSEYTAGLEKRIASLEDFIKKLTEASPAERDALLGTAAASPADPDQPSTSHIATFPRATTPRQTDDADVSRQAHFQRDAQGSFIYHGATSIFNSDLLSSSEGRHSSAVNPPSESNFQHVLEHFGIASEDDTTLRALKQFFRWQYPHFMFVYREAFLRDHFGHRRDCKYWSEALLLSVCALGLLVSATAAERDISERFFQAAESIAIVSGLGRPSIPTVQAFLCLAFFEIGRGNVSKGWGFSGIAFRMAQDLGFQNDPATWLHDSTSLTPEDVEVRRRIYWGCYISDKLISLTLGRPVQLSFDSARVDLLQFIPDGPEMRDWRPAGFDDDPDDLGNSSNIPYLKEQIRLYKIVEDMMTRLFSPRAQAEPSIGQAVLDGLNLDLLKWRDALPPFARWNKWASGAFPTPAIATLHLIYNSIRIALNYEQATTGTRPAREIAREYCVASAQDILTLVRNYKLQYGLRHSPLVLIYAIVQASRAIKAFGISEEQGYLLNSLADCSQTWSIASQVALPGPKGSSSQSR